MRTVLLTFAIFCTIAISGTAFAQTPTFQVYFDEGYQDAAADCPAGPIGTVLDTLHVVAHNFNVWVGAAEFMVDYSDYLTWLGEEVIGTELKIGSTPDGIAITWPGRRNGFQALEMVRVTVQWMCNDCQGIGGTPGAEIVVMPYPGRTSPRIVEYNTQNYIDGVGMKSLVCAQVPVEQTTWGQIKSLYH